MVNIFRKGGIIMDIRKLLGSIKIRLEIILDISRGNHKQEK